MSSALFLSGTKWEMMEQIRADIRDFKKQKNLEKVNNGFMAALPLRNITN